MDTQSWINHIDFNKRFQLRHYPSDFITRERNSDELLKFTLAPERAVYFTRRQVSQANSPISNQPADLELKIYRMIQSYSSIFRSI